jgi:hypothetical protein
VRLAVAQSCDTLVLRREDARVSSNFSRFRGT